MSGVKGAKLLVWSSSANVPQKILDDCKSFSIPALRFNGNPVELGRACGIPFRVSVIAVKSAGDADLQAFSNATDYMSLANAPPVIANQEETAVEVKEIPEAQKKRVSKRKTKSKTEEKEVKTESEKPKKTTRKRKTTEEKPKHS